MKIIKVKENLSILGIILAGCLVVAGMAAVSWWLYFAAHPDAPWWTFFLRWR